MRRRSTAPKPADVELVLFGHLAFGCHDVRDERDAGLLSLSRKAWGQVSRRSLSGRGSKSPSYLWSASSDCSGLCSSLATGVLVERSW